MNQVSDETITTINTIEYNAGPVADKLAGINFSRVAAAAVLNDSVASENGDNVKITSRNYRLFEVEPISSFGAILLAAPFREDCPVSIPSIAFRSWTSFTQVFRSILVNYYMEFGSFDRIKRCAQCGKLFFEKKKTARMFCGRNCMKKHSDGPPERYNCRMKQNRWLNYRFEYDRSIDTGDLDGVTMKKADCGNCVAYSASGECVKLREKNPQLFSLLQTS